MSDDRIGKYREAAVALSEGRFDVEIPTETEDDIGRLGQSLLELARALERRHKEDEKLARLSEELNEGLLLNDVLDHVYDAFHTLIPYHRLDCALLEKDGKVLRAVWTRSDRPATHLTPASAPPWEGGGFQSALTTGRPIIVNDLDAYVREHADALEPSLLAASGFRSIFACPLILFDKPVGFLFFISRDVDTYRRVHQEIFSRIATQVAAVIEKSRLYQQLHELNRELRATRDALRVQATHDTLTGLWNRGAIFELLDRQLARARRQKSPIAVIMADIDHFKNVNDTRGHQVGDSVLHEVAKRLAAALRHGDFIGRFGGEEFLMVCLPGIEAEVMAVGERLRRAVGEHPIATSAGNLHVTLSLGVAATTTPETATVDMLVGAADAALYRAKTAGRNRLAFECCE